ncbi:MAG: hypothetical protein R3A80_05750 [Bdellovibrionota bacterium]
MKTSKKKTKSGQSTIEFIFVFFAFIFFLSMSYNAVISFAVYQYLSYANFMAARAYQPARTGKLDQRNAAISAMGVYVPGIEVGSQNTLFAFSSKRPLARIRLWAVPEPDSQNLPFILQFEVPFLTLPLGDDIKQTFGTLTLKTTVMLGREPSRDECRFYFSNLFNSLGGSSPHTAAAMEDNGC